MCPGLCKSSARVYAGHVRVPCVHAADTGTSSTACVSVRTRMAAGCAHSSRARAWARTRCTCVGTRAHHVYAHPAHGARNAHLYTQCTPRPDVYTAANVGMDAARRRGTRVCVSAPTARTRVRMYRVHADCKRMQVAYVHLHAAHTHTRLVRRVHVHAHTPWSVVHLYTVHTHAHTAGARTRANTLHASTRRKTGHVHILHIHTLHARAHTAQYTTGTHVSPYVHAACTYTVHSHAHISAHAAHVRVACTHRMDTYTHTAHSAYVCTLTHCIHLHAVHSAHACPHTHSYDGTTRCTHVHIRTHGTCMCINTPRTPARVHTLRTVRLHMLHGAHTNCTRVSTYTSDACVRAHTRCAPQHPVTHRSPGTCTPQ